MTHATTTSKSPSDELTGFQRLRLSWRLFRDGRVPNWMKALVPIFAMLYVFAPIDLIPDFVLGLGQLDDLSVLGFSIFVMTRLLPRLAPREVVDDHLSSMSKASRRREPTNVVDATYEVVGRSAGDTRWRETGGI